MAKNNSPFTLNSRGSVDGMIFSSAFGVKYFKTRPLTISNPRTPKQTSQRLAMSLVTATWQQIESFGNVAYKKRAIGMSSFNQFSHQNLSQDKMNIDLVTNVAVWLPSILQVKANPSQQGVSTVVISGANATGNINSLPPSRNFVMYAIAQNVAGEIGTVVKVGGTSSNTGVLTVDLEASDFGFIGLSLVAISIFDEVSGQVSNFTSIV